MNNWQILSEFIDANEYFSAESLRTLGLSRITLEQYRFFLKKAEFIQPNGYRKYKRTKLIGDLTVYAVKEIGYKLEVA